MPQKLYIITCHLIEDTEWSKVFSSLEKCNEFLETNYPGDYDEKFSERENMWVETGIKSDPFNFHEMLMLFIVDLDSMKLPGEED